MKETNKWCMFIFKILVMYNFFPKKEETCF